MSLKSVFVILVCFLLSLAGSAVRAQEATLTTVHNFSVASKGGISPSTGLVLGDDGNYYGTTYLGGTSNVGTAYELDASGVVTIIHSYDRATGAFPEPFIMGSDGNLYGATNAGGTYNEGVVYRMSLAGDFTVLHNVTKVNSNNINADGIGAFTPTESSQGNYYGVCGNGGSDGFGTIYEISSSGVFSKVYDFDGVNGAHPASPLALAANGNLYGITTSGGANGAGSVFKFQGRGTYRLISSLTASDDISESYGILQAANGGLYGTCFYGGADNVGMFFKITTAGAFKTLYTFNNVYGVNPEGLIQAKDGYFYGVTYRGGANNAGTIYRINYSGVIKTLYTFTGGSDGFIPNGTLVQASDGSFYGTTYAGGSHSEGTIFRLTLDE